MPLPVTFATLTAGNQQLALFDTQFAALGALVRIPCTASGSNAVVLTPLNNTPSVTTYAAGPIFVWTQAQTSTGPVTIQVGGLSALAALKQNGALAVGASDLVGGNAYQAYYQPATNSMIVDVMAASGGGGGTGAGALLSSIVYTTSQTVTIPAGATKAYIKMWGATGGSGGVSNAVSQGSGAGGYLEKYLTSLTPGNTFLFTVGSAGSAGPTNGAGGSGTQTTLISGTQTLPASLICNPSLGTPAGYGNNNVPAGGTATGGDVNVTGQQGGIPSSLSNVAGGAGGKNFYSLGANGVTYGPGAGAGNPGNPGGMIIQWLT